jgi:amidophosphoribosyltransferase
MALEFDQKNVLIVDGTSSLRIVKLVYNIFQDSIVRGTTSKEIVQMAKDVGAKRVIVASCAPPIRYVCSVFARLCLNSLPDIRTSMA